VCRPLPSPRHRCASQDQNNHSCRVKELLGSVILLQLVVMMPFFSFFRAFRVAVRSMGDFEACWTFLIYREAGWLDDA
jgi:hypothetical protein